MTLVVDASLMIAALVDDGPDGEWARELMQAHDLAAPHLLPIETAHALRRGAMSKRISDDVASIAHAQLLELRVDLFAYAPLAPRVWELRANLTAYDAYYVAVAEGLDAPLGTLDARLSRANGPRCRFALPPKRAR